MGNAPSADSVASVVRLRDALLLALDDALPSTSTTAKSIQTRLLDLFLLYDETRTGVIPQAFVTVVANEVALKAATEHHVAAVAALFDLQGDDTFAYVEFLEFVFFPVVCYPPRLALTRSMGPLDVYTVHEGEFAARFGSPQAQQDPTFAATRVLVKELALLRPDEQQSDALAMLRLKANSLRLLRHVNILRVRATVQSGWSLFVVHDWYESGSLKTTLMAFGPMKEPTVRRYLHQILEGLQFLHDQGVSHGNLQCESVYIDSYGLLKLGVRYSDSAGAA